MSNFPIAIMVKLTYNIYEGDFMAEFCLDCYNKIHNRKDKKYKYILSADLDLCEGCGEWKQVIIAERWYYYAHKLRYIILPIRIIAGIIGLIFKLIILPYFIFKYLKEK